MNKAAGIDNTYGKKDGATMIIIPVTQIWNLYIKLSHFSKTCKLGLIVPLYKQGTQTGF